MKIAIDTNRYTDFVKNEPTAVKVIGDADRVYLPFPVVGELHAGFKCGSRTEANEAVLSRFLSNKRVEVLYPDSVTLRVYADLYAELRGRGTPIPTNDLWIAALVIQYSLPLCSRDAHFDNFPQIPRV